MAVKVLSPGRWTVPYRLAGQEARVKPSTGQWGSDGKRNRSAANRGIGLASEAGLCDGGNQPRGWTGDWIPVSGIAIACPAAASNCGRRHKVSSRYWYGRADA